MHFNEYLKQCRENNHLTQEQLASDLYGYDIDGFEGLDTNTISKWERAIIKPKLSRQVSIIKYFQQRTGVALPCWENYSVDEAEEMICKVGMKNLLGKSKELILNFPSAMIGADDLSTYQLRNSAIIDKVIDINIDLDKDFNHKFTGLEAAQFKKWAILPSNSFYYCEYKDQFFGLLFTLRLKPSAFERIMNQDLSEKELENEHFASLEELGSNYIISFFAMNEKAASMLFIQYYAHLIANQKFIKEVGAATLMEDAKKLINNMNLHLHTSKMIGRGLELQTYRETLPNFLACENVVKMILSKQECPEE